MSSSVPSISTAGKVGSEAPRIPHPNNTTTSKGNHLSLSGNAATQQQNQSSMSVSDNRSNYSISVKSEDMDKIKHIKVIQIETPK